MTAVFIYHPKIITFAPPKNTIYFMNTIQDLTDQLFHEGVEKGTQEAEKMVAQAEAKKTQILEEAQKQADMIVEKAKKQAAELEKNTKAELQLFARQAVDALKSEVVNLLNDKVVRSSVATATEDKAFMQQLLLSFVKEWAAGGNLCVETAQADALTKFFQNKAADMLDKGLEIKQVNQQPADFVLTAKDGSYKIQFGQEDFIEYFKEFLRPKLVEMLF